MVVLPTVQRFDPTKPVASIPGSPSRFHSGDMRANFQALSRANDLRCTQQNPPDLTVFVEAGAYAISSQQTQHFPSGNSSVLDTTTGGTLGWQKVFVLELDSTNNLIWNANGAWTPTAPTAPPYTDQRIPLCEVLVTHSDAYITQPNIFDVRPMINLGVGLAQLVNPGQVTLTATIPGQTDFDTSAHFHFFPGQHEILVWTDPPSTYCGGVPSPCFGLLYRIVDIDYIELDDHTIRFLPPYAFALGDRVVIWKIGISATPGTIALSDLSDVSGNEAAAFHTADAPTGINPYLTVSGHNSINHLTSVPSLAPVVAHLVTAATNAAHRHHAVEIEVSQSPTPLLYNTTATDVQTALVSLSTNLYFPFRQQHEASGTHGPKVTILQTNADNALSITKSNTGAVNAVDITNGGTGYGLNINQSGEATALAITKFGAGSNPAILITNSGTGTGAGLRVYQSGNAAGVRVEKSNTGSVPAIEVLSSNAGAGIAVVQNGTDPGSHGITITQSTGGSSLSVNHSVPGQDAVVITRNASGTKSAVLINQSHTGSLNSALVINNSGSLYGLHVENFIPASTSAVVKIDNHCTSSGYDIQGSNNSWRIDKLGNISTDTSATISTDLSVVHNTYLVKSAADGGSGGFLRTGKGPDLTLTLVPGGANYVILTHTLHRVDCTPGNGLRFIYTGSLGNTPSIGTVVMIAGPLNHNPLLPRTDAPGSNQTLNGNYLYSTVLTYVWMGDLWYAVGF